MQSSKLDEIFTMLLTMHTIVDRFSVIFQEHPELRERGGQNRLVEMTGASKSVVSQWLNQDIKTVRLEYALGLERHLGYSHIWLMIGEGEKMAQKSKFIPIKDEKEQTLIETYRKLPPTGEESQEWVLSMAKMLVYHQDRRKAEKHG